MTELVYSVENIFSDSTAESCLTQNGVKAYYIAAYQRGYKWDWAVTKLLEDILHARRTKAEEYYLQYITIKKIADRFEVIDGQQRLTTLSLLLSVLTLRINELNHSPQLSPIDNIAKDKIEYAIRENFLSTYIYNANQLRSLLTSEWDDQQGLKISPDLTINNQDIYYIFHAAKKIDRFVKDELEGDQIQDFHHYLLTNVKLIVNIVDHISSERIFSNLNSNKVALSESDLIKALILTKISRVKANGTESPNFREILEMRLNLGRRWDEICSWANRSDIRSFFFPKHSSDAMTDLLSVVCKRGEYKIEGSGDPKDYPLFNAYNNVEDLRPVYNLIVSTYLTLKNWYENDEIYNRLGFLFFAKSSRITLDEVFKQIELEKSALLSYLNSEVMKLISDHPSELRYGESDAEIHRVLLSVNLFTTPERRYDFEQHIKQSWTLEHIFPQTPEGKGQVLQEKDKQLILDMLGDKSTDKIKRLLHKKERSDEEKAIYEQALQTSEPLNSIGNMCLLDHRDNVAIGCRMFDKKREKILQLTRTGSFVPPHTFDVFSKMIFSNDPQSEFADRWTADHIEKHQEIICQQILHIKDKLRKQ